MASDGVVRASRAGTDNDQIQQRRVHRRGRHCLLAPAGVYSIRQLLAIATGRPAACHHTAAASAATGTA